MKKSYVFSSVVETECYKLLTFVKNCIPLIIGKTRNKKNAERYFGAKELTPVLN